MVEFDALRSKSSLSLDVLVTVIVIVIVITAISINTISSNLCAPPIPIKVSFVLYSYILLLDFAIFIPMDQTEQESRWGVINQSRRQGKTSSGFAN